jgi:hypothetical protein
MLPAYCVLSVSVLMAGRGWICRYNNSSASVYRCVEVRVGIEGAVEMH